MKALPSRRKKLIAAIKGAAARSSQMNFIVELEQEEDGRWIAEVVDIPGALAYGQSQQEALARVEAVALRVIAEKLDQGEIQVDLVSGQRHDEY
jgi:predicted RNase H-like HicB family nuclease